MSVKKKQKRYSISLSGKTYDRLRGTVTSPSLQKFVDAIMASALDDPTAMKHLVEKCQQSAEGA